MAPKFRLLSDYLASANTKQTTTSAGPSRPRLSVASALKSTPVASTKTSKEKPIRTPILKRCGGCAEVFDIRREGKPAVAIKGGYQPRCDTCIKKDSEKDLTPKRKPNILDRWTMNKEKEAKATEKSDKDGGVRTTKKWKAETEVEGGLVRKIARIREKIGEEEPSSRVNDTSYQLPTTDSTAPLEYQTPEKMVQTISKFLFLHSCSTDGTYADESESEAEADLSLDFQGTYSIVRDPKIGNKMRVELVSKELKVIPVDSNSQNPESRPGYYEKTFRCAKTSPGHNTPGSVSGKGRCGGTISISSQHDSSHPLNIWGQKVVVRVSHTTKS
ncbi:hypothetical protein JAAARDRAFT_57957 [Jaapia argillacea MUCL 33604]|uniref:Uncharacterized protein n=1 Tax=Jaapia argillacea MUCL 33604 TaxID=933084 RepID=A0A067Q404_9AGAM|nr:hypothetical protein JAAARDRAFT_57957 [Jaapia argillacea MUCL 33604]